MYDGVRSATCMDIPDFRVKTTIQLYTNIMYYRNLKNRTIDAFEG